MNRRRGALARAGGLAVIALGAGAIVLARTPVSIGGAPRNLQPMFFFFGGVILIAGGIRLLVGSEKLNELLKPGRNRRR